MEEFSKSGRKLRPRRAKVQGGDGESRSHSGARPAFGGSRSTGEHKSFGRRAEGGSRPFGRRTEDGERKPFGERKSFGDRKPFGDRKSFGDRRPRRASDEGIDRMVGRKTRRDAERAAHTAPVEVMAPGEMRLNRFIAASGVCSRREADTYIEAGLVTVNGEVVTQLGTKVNADTDDVRFNGERLRGEEKVYLVMNKPRGYVTTASDPHADKTVMDLIKGCSARVYPVGRLDKATTGVLMFTNDGEMSERLTHPSYDKKKIYQVTLDRELSQEDHDIILAGITLQDGEIAADELEYIDEGDRRKLGIEIHSGKNRIVRRIFESLGYTVKALDRVYFAGLTKKGLKKGEWRYLTQGEINILKMGAYA